MGTKHSMAKRKLVQGVGINDADYCTRQLVNGKQTHCPFEQRWNSMLKRCYSAKWHSYRPTYIGCKVCEEWHSFMAFKSWMELQDWKGKHLDKDLIGCGKLYSPENCVFVSSELNNLFIDCGTARGEHPVGVSWKRQIGKFRAAIRVNNKSKHLGCFDSAETAHAAWLNAKLEIANRFIENESNPRIRHAIECGIAKLSRESTSQSLPAVA